MIKMPKLIWIIGLIVCFIAPPVGITILLYCVYMLLFGDTSVSISEKARKEMERRKKNGDKTPYRL